MREEQDELGVELLWPGKLDAEGRLTQPPRVVLPFAVRERVEGPRSDGWRDKLIWGDNLLVLSSLQAEFAGRIDLIYSDPPFFSGLDFALRYRGAEGGELLPTNAWATKNARAGRGRTLACQAYGDRRKAGLGAYAAMMRDRILLMRELLAESGHFFLHCDQHVHHVLRLICDEIFSPDCFKGEIVWQRTRGGGRVAAPSKFDIVTDNILFYSKRPETRIARQSSRRRIPEAEALRRFHFDEARGQYFKHAPRGNYSDETIAALDREGRIYWTKNGNPRVKTFLEFEEDRQQRYVVEERPITNLWTDLSDMMHVGPGERTGYPTQKPEDLLERILRAGSEEGALIADFFAGSGTSLAVARRLDRRWIGCDSGRLAVQTARKRLLAAADGPGFDLLEFGSAERRHWLDLRLGRGDAEVAEDELRRLVLAQYGAEPIADEVLSGAKGADFVLVAPADGPLAPEGVARACARVRERGGACLHLLLWEDAPELADEAPQAQEGVELRRLCIPRELLEAREQAAGRVEFFAPGRIELELSPVAGRPRELRVALRGLGLEPGPIPAAWAERVDSWSLDPDFRAGLFVNRWSSFRRGRGGALELESPVHRYAEPGDYLVSVRVTDVFGREHRRSLAWRAD